MTEDRQSLADLTAVTGPRIVSEPDRAYSWLQDERAPERVALAAEKAAMIRRSSSETCKRMTDRTFRCPGGRTLAVVYRIPGEDGGLLAVPAPGVKDGRDRAEPWWIIRPPYGVDRRLRCRCHREPTPVGYR